MLDTIQAKSSRRQPIDRYVDHTCMRYSAQAAFQHPGFECPGNQVHLQRIINARAGLVPSVAGSALAEVVDQAVEILLDCVIVEGELCCGPAKALFLRLS